MNLEVNDFLTTISDLLKEGDTRQVSILCSKEQLYNHSWDLIPVMGQYLSEYYQQNNAEVYKCCQKLIDIIADHSKPEEVLLQFIEEIELAKDDVKFLAILKPTKTILLRIPDKRITSLAWCFNAIKHYLEMLEIPDALPVVDEERLLLNASGIVSRISNLYENVLIFSEAFVKELANGGVGDFWEKKQVIGKFLLELLGKPLAFLDMGIYKNIKQRARIIAEDLVENLCFLTSDPFLFLGLRDKVDNDLEKPNDLALGVFYYLTLSEHVQSKHIPKVYSPTYIFQNCLCLANSLLGQENQFVLEKGMNLTASLLTSVDHQELSYLLLDAEHHSKFCHRISEIIIYNRCEHVRKKSLQLLEKYLWSFEHKGRYLVIIHLMHSLTHSGLKGNIVMQYKRMLTEEIKNGRLENISEYYRDSKLFNVLDKFTFLKDKEQTDLVDNSDQIVSTLNLLRYLILVDKKGDIGIDDYQKNLENGYFTYLKIGITMAKEHYRLKIKEINEEDGRKNDLDCRVSVNVSGENLLEMPTKKKIEIMNLSLTTLDVIDSLLSRTMECVNLKRAIV